MIYNKTSELCNKFNEANIDIEKVKVLIGQAKEKIDFYNLPCDVISSIEDFMLNEKVRDQFSSADLQELIISGHFKILKHEIIANEIMLGTTTKRVNRGPRTTNLLILKK